MAFLQMDKNPKVILDSNADYIRYAKNTYETAFEFSKIIDICFPGYFLQCMRALCSNAAFASELFIKSIIYNNLKQKCKSYKLNIHNLYDLFNYLPEEVKKAIKELHPCSNSSKDNFELELKETGEAFFVLRYGHERTELACNVVFIIELMAVLREYCAKLFKT